MNRIATFACLLAPLALSACGSNSGGDGDPILPPPPPAAEDREFATTIINPPCARLKGGFGFSTVILDWDGDGIPDLGIGAPGEGAVHVVMGNGDGTFGEMLSFQASGQVDCPYDSASDRLGEGVEAADVDGDGDDELIAGAPWATVAGEQLVGAVYVFGLASAGPVPLQILSDVPTGYFGAKVKATDFDNDGLLDLAIGAPKAPINGNVRAGRVHLFYAAFDQALRNEVLLDDPAPVPHGNFGYHLAIDDTDGDGFKDLFVTAIGNTNSFDVPSSGQAYGYWGPPQPEYHFFVEDAEAIATDFARFGMYIAARDGLLMVGAPRRRIGAIDDTGLAFMWSAPSFAPTTSVGHPEPLYHDLFGYRVELGNVIGDEAIDAMALSLPTPSNPEPNARTLFMYDKADLTSEAVRLFPLIDSGSHSAVGIFVGQMIAEGWEEIVMGDSRYEPPGSPATDSGRVVLYY